MENDRTLLRPFDLEAAKAGEPICWPSENTPVTFIGACSKGAIAYETEHNRGFTYQEALRMAPLCWIEHKPVYKGDVLYSKATYRPVVIGGYLEEQHCFSIQDSLVWLHDGNLTWTKPVTKVKKDGWINIYPFNSINSPELNADTGPVYVTEDEALKKQRRTALATIHIEWEEEAK